MTTPLATKNPSALIGGELKTPCKIRTGQNITRFATLCQVPFWSTHEMLTRVAMPLKPGTYGQCKSKTLEVFKRIFMMCGAITLSVISIPLYLINSILTAIGNRLNSRHYNYLRGKAEPISIIDKEKVLHLNVCMMSGGLPIPYGGVMPARFRIKDLTNFIKDQNPNILFLSEMSRMTSYRISKLLKDQFHHFFVDIGPNSIGIESGLMVAYRGRLERMPEFNFFKTRGYGGQWFTKRGFFQLETPLANYFFTHLHPHASAKDREVREKQIQEIETKMDQVKNGKPCYLIGDLNIDRYKDSKQEYADLIQKGYADLYKRAYPNSSLEQDITCTEALNEMLEKNIKPKDGKYEILDYALLRENKELKIQDLNLLSTYDLRKPDSSLSDHKALVYTTYA